jgi:hypothetical protein
MSEDDKDSNATKIYSSDSEASLKTAAYSTQTDSRTDRTTTHDLGIGDTVQLAGS